MAGKSQTGLQSKLKTIDDLIKNAKESAAREQFLLLTKVRSWSREDLVDLCQMARRLQMPNLILKWLHPIVRSEKILQRPAEISELALYASGLTKVGAFSEAEEILKDLDASQFNDVNFFSGFPLYGSVGL